MCICSKLHGYIDQSVFIISNGPTRSTLIGHCIFNVLILYEHMYVCLHVLVYARVCVC